MNELAEDALTVLRQRLRAAGAALGELHPTTARLRADLTGLLIQLGRDREAAELEAGTLVLPPEEGRHDGR